MICNICVFLWHENCHLQACFNNWNNRTVISIWIIYCSNSQYTQNDWNSIDFYIVGYWMKHRVSFKSIPCIDSISCINCSDIWIRTMNTINKWNDYNYSVLFVKIFCIEACQCAIGNSIRVTRIMFGRIFIENRILIYGNIPFLKCVLYQCILWKSAYNLPFCLFYESCSFYESFSYWA